MQWLEMLQTELLNKLEPGTQSPDEEIAAHAQRLSALVSLEYFIRVVLKRERLRSFHKMLCQSLESEDLHLVLEVPMGHFKTTIGTEGLSMWWALPFTEADEASLDELGCGPEWIRWMKKAHDFNTRTLVVHEVESLAIKMGHVVDAHYEHNDVFRTLFPEIIPSNDAVWNDHTKTQRRNATHGEGTYEYRGVGQSLQSLHMDGVIEDDLVGKAAQDSMRLGDNRVMESTISYHRKVSTRFDPASFTKTGMGRQVVIGNRWGHADLNAWIRANQQEFRIETHSAEGGCCKRHPAGTPIFPEEYTMERLSSERQTLGNYDYSHFYLNQAVLPEECIFKPEWLRYYWFKPSRADLPLDDPRNELTIEHEVAHADPIPDINVGILSLRMIIDPNHAGKRGRCRHAIVVVGYDTESDRVYLLDVWAEIAPYSDLVANIYRIARKWGLRQAWLETVAGQGYLKFYFDEQNTKEKHPLTINELRDYSANAKERRIEALEPIFRNRQFYCHRTQKEFLEEYNAYPASSRIDVLDALGYAPQCFEVIRRKEMYQWLRTQEQGFKQRTVGPAGY